MIAVNDHEGDIFDTAAAWQARLVAAPLPPAEAAALLAWLRADVRHAEALEAARAGWALAGELAEVPALVAERRRARTLRLAEGAFAPPATPAATATAPRPAPWPLSRPLTGAPRPRRWAGLAAAAAIAGVLVAGQPPPAQAFETAHGEALRAVLADGSTILLNTDSRVVVAYGWFVNTVTIERGEAEVTPAPKVMLGLHRALHVRVNGAEARPEASVAVRDFGDSASVIALAAPVELRRPGAAPVVLGPADRGLLEGGRRLRVARVDPAQALAWRQGQLIFDHSSLAAAATEFERYASVRISVAPEVAGLEVSGAYRTRDMRAFLDALPAIHPVRWRQVAPGAVRIEATDS